MVECGVIQLIVLYAHRNVGTEVSLKVVTGGVRYRAQRREQQKYLGSSVCEALSECIKPFFCRHPFFGCRMDQHLAKYITLRLKKIAPSDNEGADVAQSYIIKVLTKISNNGQKIG